MYGRYAITEGERAVRTLEVEIDAAESGEWHGIHVAAAIVRGVANFLPPRWDPWFLKRCEASGLFDDVSVAPARSRTKLDAVLAATRRSTPDVSVLFIDVDAAGTYGHAAAARVSAAPARVMERQGTRRPVGRMVPGTGNVAVLVVGRSHQSVEVSCQQAGLSVARLCRGVSSSQVTVELEAVTTRLVVPVTRPEDLRRSRTREVLG